MPTFKDWITDKREPGGDEITIGSRSFCIVVLIGIIIGILVYATSGDCADAHKVPAVRYMVEVQRVAKDGGVSFGTGLGFPSFNEQEGDTKVIYHHYIQPASGKPVLMFTTETPPCLVTLIRALQAWEKMQNEKQ